MSRTELIVYTDQLCFLTLPFWSLAPLMLPDASRPRLNLEASPFLLFHPPCHSVTRSTLLCTCFLESSRIPPPLSLSMVVTLIDLWLSTHLVLRLPQPSSPLLLLSALSSLQPIPHVGVKLSSEILLMITWCYCSGFDNGCLLSHHKFSSLWLYGFFKFFFK